MLRPLRIPLARLSRQVECLLAENRILRSKIQGLVRLGRKLLEVAASIAKPDTILDWHRRLVERKPPKPGRAGRPMVPWDTRDLVARIARETVHVTGLTTNPRESRMLQSARSLTMAAWGFLEAVRPLLHDRDRILTPASRRALPEAGVATLRLPRRSPNLNAFAERFVRSVKEGCLSRLVLFGERSLRRPLDKYLAPFHQERNDQGLAGRIPRAPPDAPAASPTVASENVRGSEDC